MLYIIYFLIAVLATSIGAVTGMGGGVFIKPLLDIMGHYHVGSISMMSSITVFVMAVVSLVRQRNSPDKPTAAVAIPAAIGAVLGGNLGNILLNIYLSRVEVPTRVTIAQNAILAALVVIIFFYMLFKERITPLGKSGWLPSALTGLILGVLSSFLGIGGGPFNVALIIFIFAFSTKTAALCSLIIILFSQGAKLLVVLFNGGFSSFQLEMLPVMVVGAVIGGLAGSGIQKRIKEKTADVLFNLAQVIVFAMCVLNIIRNWS